MSFFAINGLLDPDERDSVVKKKLECMRNGYSAVPFRDPLDGFISALNMGFNTVRIDVEGWLTPTPPEALRFMTAVENYVSFIDSNGCLEYANKVRDAISSKLGQIPLLLGVDHSLTGGAVAALAKEYGGESMRLIVFDSHFDFILPTIRCGLIQYDLETNPATRFSPEDPYIFGRPDSYNADSFLHYVLKDVPPENILVVGVSDYPPRVAREIDDDRVKRYLDYYAGLESQGVTVIKKADIKSSRADVCAKLSSSDKPYTYVSIDVDVCSNTSLKGARFLDYHGVDHRDLYGLVAAIAKSTGKSKLVGIDFMEFDVFSAGAVLSGKQDRTYAIMAEAFRRLTQEQT
ncbi:MAG TPA: arginase family protein [Candidatus Methanomethylicus sp.]|nr:arginase family protein [Candidatus Methanomethylicus sp.]